MTQNKTALTPEILVPRVGHYLVEKGIITRDELYKALERQKELSNVSPVPLIGQVLVDMGVINRDVLDEAVTEQIMQLKFALQEANQELEMRVAQRTQALQIALTKLSELDKLKSNFIANISHELRTPLTHIRGYLELFHNAALGPMTIDQNSAVTVMMKASERLEKLIDDLILFTTSERGELSIQPEAFKIDSIISLIYSNYYQKAEDKKIRIHQSVTTDLPLVYADKDKIKWVISELVDNAIKFSPKNSKILIKAETLDYSAVQITILDNGIGIQQDKLQEIFEPFHQLDSSPTRKFGGTGLGLYMVREILQTHKINIRVTSQVGVGSSFQFSLPTARNDNNQR